MTARPPAPPLSATEAATVERFENAEPAPESWVCVCGHDGLLEQWHADHCLHRTAPDSPAVEQRPTDRDTLRALADEIREATIACLDAVEAADVDKATAFAVDIDRLLNALPDLLARLDAAEAKVRAVERLAEELEGHVQHGIAEIDEWEGDERARWEGRVAAYATSLNRLRAALAAGAPEGGRR